MTIRGLLGVLTALMVGVAAAQNVPVAGIDYQEIKSPSNASPQETIEVVEYFWYRCSHCYALEPLLEPWASQLPEGARFRRIPAVLGKEWTVAFESAAVHEKARRAAELSRALKLEGTPTFMVAGRYLVSPPLGERRRILEITDYLVSRAQAEKLARR